MHGKTDRVAVTGVLDLRDVLQLVNDHLNQDSFAQQQLINHKDKTVLRVVAQRRNELKPSDAQLLLQRLTEVAFVAEELAKQTFTQRRDRVVPKNL